MNRSERLLLGQKAIKELRMTAKDALYDWSGIMAARMDRLANDLELALAEPATGSTPPFNCGVCEDPRVHSHNAIYNQEWDRSGNNQDRKQIGWSQPHYMADRLSAPATSPSGDKGAAPWLYAIEGANGEWTDGESCVFGDRASAQDEVDLLNDSLEEEHRHKVVPLYREAREKE